MESHPHIPHPNLLALGRLDTSMVPEPHSPNLSGEELYVVIRRAVEDAILSAVGSLILALLGFGIIWIGMVIGVESLGQNILQVGAGGFLVLFGLYIAGTALDLIPSLESMW